MSIEETLAEALRPVLREELEKALDAHRGSPTKLLDAAGAAELLSLSVESVRTLSKRHVIPRVVLPNGRVRYRADELLRWGRGES